MQDRALETIKRVLVSHAEAPVEDMERLIVLGAEDPVLAHQLREGAVEVLSADPASLVPCWLALIAGELGPASGELLLSALGTSEGDALDATILCVLTRRAAEFYDAITGGIEHALPEEREMRGSLYSVLLAVVIGGDEALRARLRTFARARVAAEAAMPEGLGAVAEVADLVTALEREDQRPGERDGRLGSIAALAHEDWRVTARRIAASFRGQEV